MINEKKDEFGVYFPLTLKEAEAIVEGLKFHYINREENEAFYTIITSLARFVENNK